MKYIRAWMSSKFGQIRLQSELPLSVKIIDVATFSRLLFIRSILYLKVSRTYIISRRSSNFGQIGPPTMELSALESLKNTPLDLKWGKL